MPQLPDYLSSANTLSEWLRTTNNLISYVSELELSTTSANTSGGVGAVQYYSGSGLGSSANLIFSGTELTINNQSITTTGIIAGDGTDSYGVDDTEYFGYPARVSIKLLDYSNAYHIGMKTSTNAIGVISVTPHGGLQLYSSLEGTSIYGDMYFTGDATYVQANTWVVNNDFIPGSNNSHQLGIASRQWSRLYVNSISITGNLTANGANGTAGQILTSNGIGPYWAFSTATVLSKSANYTVQTSDGSPVVVLCTNTITITLYAANGNAGKIIHIKNIGTGTITIDGNASETIDGSTTNTISVQYGSLSLVCDGSNWHII